MDKPLCCLVRDATEEKIYEIKEKLKHMGKSDYIVHGEDLYFYYPKDITEKQAREEAEEILKRRFVKGEISSYEYTEKMARL